MAALLIESLSHNKSSFQIAVRAIEILLLSAGLVSTFLMLKGAVYPYSSYDLILSTLRKPLSYFRSWLSSSFYICIILNFIVILIAVSSFLHRHRIDNNSDIEDGGDNEEYDYLHSTLSPTLSPPPMHPKHENDRKQKEKSVATAVAAEVAETTKSGGKIRTETASLKIQQDAEHTKRVEKDSTESFQDVLSDFCRLTKAKEIKKAPSTRVGDKVKPTTASFKNQLNTEDTNGFKSIDGIFQAVFPELTETKEVKKVHSVDSSLQVDKIQKGTRTIIEKQNQLHQTNKKLENEDSEEEDTMEATWRAITGGGAKPQKKQLKKSETWPQPQTVVGVEDNNNDIEEDMPSSAAAWKELKKSMTFNDTVSIRCRGGLRRDSVNMEEFNQRVEAFIKNFNDEMRLQRQESEQRYFDQINRGLRL